MALGIGGVRIAHRGLLDESMSAVQTYYASYHPDTAEAVRAALENVLDPQFGLESPLVAQQRGGPVSGAEAFAVAAAAAPLLKNAILDVLYATASGQGVAALIHFPSPAGVIVQSEHFDLDPMTGKITRLRSYYDPRPLLGA